MYVIDVIPLSRTAPGVLSYRSRAELPVGSIVDIVLRKAPTQGIVLSCVPVADAKEMLKHARFLLAKSAPSASGMLPADVLAAAQATALYHATSIGSVLAALLAEHIKSGAALPLLPLQRGDGYVRETAEGPLAERAALYEARIRSAQGRKRALLLVVPTIAELLYWKERFAASKPLALSGTLPPAKRSDALAKAAAATGLVIATPSFSWTPIDALSGIIIERISAGTYALPKRPYLSMPRSLESLARARSVPLLIGDYPLPLEYADEAAAAPAMPENISVIDMRRDKDDPEPQAWQVLPQQVLEEMKQEIEGGGRVIVLAARAGYAPAVVCRDCGQALADERGMPFSFTTSRGARQFRTSDGKSVLDAKMRCPRCDSWNLLPLGIGQERVVEELHKQFKDAPIHEANADAMRSPASARKLAKLSTEPGSITVCGEAFLPWLLLESLHADAPAPLGVIASADSLLSLPFWRSRERFVRLCCFFSTLARELVLVSRRPDDAAVAAIASKDLSIFAKEERALRAALQYPPYGVLITIAAEGPGGAVERGVEDVRERLAAYAPSQLPDQHDAGRLKRTLALLVPAGSWPDAALSRLLEELPPSMRVRVDPESL